MLRCSKRRCHGIWDGLISYVDVDTLYICHRIYKLVHVYRYILVSEASVYVYIKVTICGLYRNSLSCCYCTYTQVYIRISYIYIYIYSRYLFRGTETAGTDPVHPRAYVTLFIPRYRCHLSHLLPVSVSRKLRWRFVYLSFPRLLTSSRPI